MVVKVDSKIDLAVVVWLVVLSFWSGVSWFQIQTNRDLIDEQKDVRVRMWADVKEIRRDLSEVIGYVRARERERERKND